MKLESAKAELRERVADLIRYLRIKESESARHCVTYFHELSDTLSTIRAPVLLRCLARDRLAGRMAIARSNRFSAVATERLRSLVDLAEQILTGLEVPGGLVRRKSSIVGGAIWHVVAKRRRARSSRFPRPNP